jgi:Domain of unknown function (DUF397)
MFLTTWRKSSFSSVPDGNCVEIAWRKSSFSSVPDGDCVEVVLVPTGVAVRDSKNTSGPTLAFALGAWHGFLTEELARTSK